MRWFWKKQKETPIKAAGKKILAAEESLQAANDELIMARAGWSSSGVRVAWGDLDLSAAEGRVTAAQKILDAAKTLPGAADFNAARVAGAALMDAQAALGLAKEKLEVAQNEYEAVERKIVEKEKAAIDSAVKGQYGATSFTVLREIADPAALQVAVEAVQAEEKKLKSVREKYEAANLVTLQEEADIKKLLAEEEDVLAKKKAFVAAQKEFENAGETKRTAAENKVKDAQTELDKAISAERWKLELANVDKRVLVDKASASVNKAVQVEATTDAALSAASLAEITVSSLQGALQVLGVFTTGVFAATLGSLWLAGRKELQRAQHEIASAIEVNEALDSISQQVHQNSLTPEAARIQVLAQLNKKLGNSEADKLSAVASSGSVFLTTASFAADPLNIMILIGWIIWPVAAVIGIIAGGAVLYRSFKYGKLQEVADGLNREEQVLLARLRKQGVDVDLPFANPVEILGSENTELLQAKGWTRDKVAAGTISAIFGAITAAAVYAVLASVAVGFILACPPVALIVGVIAIIATVGTLCYRAVASKIKATATRCMNRVTRLCGHHVGKDPQVGFGASTVIRFIGAALGILALVTIPIVGWAVALGVGLALGFMSLAATWVVSQREADRENVVEGAKTTLLARANATPVPHSKLARDVGTAPQTSPLKALDKTPQPECVGVFSSHARAEVPINTATPESTVLPGEGGSGEEGDGQGKDQFKKP